MWLDIPGVRFECLSIENDGSWMQFKLTCMYLNKIPTRDNPACFRSNIWKHQQEKYQIQTVKSTKRISKGTVKLVLIKQDHYN